MPLNNNYNPNNMNMGMWNNNPYLSNPYNNYNNNYINRSSSSYPSPQQQQQVSQNNIVWVKGKENARSMQIPPNSTVILLDSEVGKFYIKTTDDIGLGRLRIFSYTEEPDEDKSNTSSESSLPNVDLSNYVTKNQLQEIVKEIRKDNEQFISTIESKSDSHKKQQLTTINKQF